MSVHIIGCKGNMGRRYAAILDHLGLHHTGEDIGNIGRHRKINADAYIIASPTHTHVELIENLLECNKPILCEKPIDTNVSEVNRLIDLAIRAKTKLSMVSQYDFLVKKSATGVTQYNYYKSGSDALYWDCINIIYHAKGKIILGNNSPVWMCCINGEPLNLAHMDGAYIKMISEWIKKPYKPQYDRIRAAHHKVLEYLDGRFS